MDHQNWEYTVFTKKDPYKGQSNQQKLNKAMQSGDQLITVKKGDTNKNHQVQGQYIAKVCNQDEYVVKTVSHDLKLAIQQARQDKGWTQEQFAKQIMEKKSVVTDYENGRAAPNQAIIAKMERSLGVRLPRPQKQKQKQQQQGGEEYYD